MGATQAVEPGPEAVVRILELLEVIALAESGAVKSHVQTFGLDEAPIVHESLHEGSVDRADGGRSLTSCRAAES